MNIKWVIKRVIKSCSWLLLTLWFPAAMVVTVGTASANEPFGMFKDTASLEPDRVLVLLAEVENCSFCSRATFIFFETSKGVNVIFQKR